MMRPTTIPSTSTSKSSSFHCPDGREAETRLRIQFAAHVRHADLARAGLVLPRSSLASVNSARPSWRVMNARRFTRSRRTRNRGGSVHLQPCRRSRVLSCPRNGLEQHRSFRRARGYRHRPKSPTTGYDLPIWNSLQSARQFHDCNFGLSGRADLSISSITI